MSDLTLTVQPRGVVGKKVRALRAAGILPAVVYGPGLQEPRSLQVPLKEFEEVYRQAGTVKPITLTIEGGSTHTVTVRDVQYNMLRRQVDHVDFYVGG